MRKSANFALQHLENSKTRKAQIWWECILDLFQHMIKSEKLDLNAFSTYFAGSGETVLPPLLSYRRLIDNLSTFTAEADMV